MTRPSVLLLPGLMCDQAYWAAQCAALRERNVEVQVADYGLADSLPEMARAALASVGGPLIVIGHSMGGRVVWEATRQAGTRLRAAAVLDTGYRPLAEGSAGERERAGRMRLLEQARRQGMRAMAQVWVRDMVHPDRLADRSLIDPILDMCERRSVAQFAAQIHALLQRPDATPALRALSIPVLLLCGEQDQWSPPPQHREMAALLSNSTLTVVPHCGHMSSMEQPEAVNRALLDWLDGTAFAAARLSC